jgi:hypothetical protein
MDEQVHEENNSTLQEIRKYRSDLRVKRLPEPWLSEFKKLADAEFASDYGMTIIFLYRYYIDDAKYKAVVDEVDRLKEELYVHLGADVNSKKERKRLDGKTIGGGV